MNTFIFKIRFIKKLKIFEIVSVILNLLYTMFIYMQINVLSDFFNKKKKKTITFLHNTEKTP